jgi:hypothetical protein
MQKARPPPEGVFIIRSKSDEIEIVVVGLGGQPGAVGLARPS